MARTKRWFAERPNLARPGFLQVVVFATEAEAKAQVDVWGSGVAWEDPCDVLEVVPAISQAEQSISASLQKTRMEDRDWKHEGELLDRELDRLSVARISPDGIVLSLYGRVLALIHPDAACSQ